MSWKKFLNLLKDETCVSIFVTFIKILQFLRQLKILTHNFTFILGLTRVRELKLSLWSSK